MEYDDPDSSVGLDRANYPKNTGVVVTIDDQALNVDPTSEDTWYLNTEGAPLYGDATGAGNIGIIAAAEIARAAAYKTADDTRTTDYKTADDKRDNAIDNREDIQRKAVSEALNKLNAVKGAIAALPDIEDLITSTNAGTSS